MTRGLVPLLLSLVACATSGPRPCARDARWLARQFHLVLDPLLQEGGMAGVVVMRRSGEVLVRLHASARLVPASTMKLVTTACALECLGPDHTFVTQLLRDGAVRNDTLFGDLVIVGGGDPSFESPEFPEPGPLESWADSVEGAGIRVVCGRVLGCADLVSSSGPGKGWAWDDLGFAFSAPGAGLCYRDNALMVRLTPATEHRPVHVTVEPPFMERLVSCLVITGPPCVARLIRLRWVPRDPTVVIEGTLPREEPTVAVPVVNPAPALTAAEALRVRLASAGLVVTGEAGTGCPRTEAVRIASHQSPPLSEIVAVTNRVSKNMWAEQLLLMVGRAGGEGTVEAGIARVHETLDRLGVPRGGLHMVDGSGLSRMNLASPAFMASLLLRATERSWGHAFERSLPVAGSTGTLAERLRGTPAEGRVRAKTGSLHGCRALCGYATTQAGDELVFAIMLNGCTQPGAVVDRIIDRLCVLMTHFAP